MYALTSDPRTSPAQPEYVTVTFAKGAPVKINGKTYGPVALIRLLNKIGGRHGVGRMDMIENRLVGIKSREIYENPAGTILHMALNDLESLVLDRETMRLKAVLSLKYAELVYNGLWETPLKQQLDAYFDKVHERSSGTVRVKLYKGLCTVVGRKSPKSRYKQKLATYGKGDQFDQKLAEGFVKLWGMPFA